MEMTNGGKVSEAEKLVEEAILQHQSDDEFLGDLEDIKDELKTGDMSNLKETVSYLLNDVANEEKGQDMMMGMPGMMGMSGTESLDDDVFSMPDFEDDESTGEEENHDELSVEDPDEEESDTSTSEDNQDGEIPVTTQMNKGKLVTKLWWLVSFP